MDDFTKHNEVKTLQENQIASLYMSTVVRKKLEKVKTLMYLRHVCHTAATMNTKL